MWAKAPLNQKRIFFFKSFVKDICDAVMYTAFSGSFQHLEYDLALMGFNVRSKNNMLLAFRRPIMTDTFFVSSIGERLGAIIFLSSLHLYLFVKLTLLYPLSGF